MEYKKQLAANLGQDSGARVLAFKQKAPAPPEGYENHMASLYTANAGARPKKAFRAVPQQPERILDAPDLVDDYYLNLLDWGSKNAVAVALNQVMCGAELRASSWRRKLTRCLTMPTLTLLPHLDLLTAERLPLECQQRRHPGAADLPRR